MKKTISFAIALSTAFSLCSCAFAKTADKSSQPLIVNGKEVTSTAYNIDSSNYFKIRDIAYLMDFDVSYDDKANSVIISPGKSYSGDKPEADTAVTAYEAKQTSQSVYINNEKTSGISIYNINGSNYFKIRDIAEAVNFGCKYNKIENKIELCSDFGYNSADVWGRAKDNDALKITFIDVGQGDSILVEFPGNAGEMLIDAGTSEAREHIISYLDNEITDHKIEYVIATHPHADHIGSMRAVVEEFEIDNFYNSRASHTTKTYTNLLDAINSRGIDTSWSIGDTVKISDNLSFTFLAPIKSDYEDLNDTSTVIKMTYKNKEFLFTGDMEQIAESDLLLSGADIKSDVVKVGHHGSNSSSSLPFIAAVLPQYAIISCGADNSYGHPAQTTIVNWQAVSAKVMSTSTVSDIVITSDGDYIRAYPDKSY